MPSDSELSERDVVRPPTHAGVFRNGKVELDCPVEWPNGARVKVYLAEPIRPVRPSGHVIIAGFGPAGRWVADVLERFTIPYVLIETNPNTVSAQRALGKRVILGDASDPGILEAAGISTASLLVLTIPDEAATIRAIQAAKAANPALVVMARTAYTSSGMSARQAGADVVVNAERAVAREFYESVLFELSRAFSPGPAGREPAGADGCGC